MLPKSRNLVAKIIILPLLVVSPFGAHGAQTIFKCCGSTGKDFQKNYPLVDFSQRIFIDNNDLISKNKTIVESIDHEVLSSVALETSQCHPNESSLTKTFLLHPNNSDQGFYSSGYLRNKEELFSVNQYCISKDADNGYIVQVQSSTFCEENHCLRKCCNPLEVYDLSTYGKSKLQCVPSVDNPWRPVFYSHSSSFSTAYFKAEAPSNWCQSANVVLWSLRTIGTDRKSLFRIMTNGSVIMKSGIAWKQMNTSRICIDGAINIPGHFDYDAKQSEFSGDELDTVILECGPDLAPKQNYSPLVMYGVALAIAAMFQFATLVVYGLLWDKQNIHGWTLLGFITTMFLFYISMLATFFYLYNYPDPDFVTEKEIFGSFCGITAVVTHFLYICTICWLTVISTDIFLTFRILKLTRTKSKNKMKFLIYLIFTLFVPSVIVCVGVVLDVNYGDDPETSIILPRYGWNKCFLDLRYAALPYLFCPLGVLLIYNCTLYLATLFHMWRLQESTKFASANSSQVQKQRAKVRMFSKLFILMGVSWILEFVTFLAFGAEANVPVMIGDMLNIIQPIAIFIIFVCKKDIAKSLGEKYTLVSKVFSSLEPEESTSSSDTRGPRLTKIWNPVSSTKWFRSRINSTMTETSNLSNQSVKSIISINAIDESPSLITSSSPLNLELDPRTK